MATFGSNIKTITHLRGMQKLFEYMLFKPSVARGGAAKLRIVQKAGVPAANTAADDPGFAPAFILDTTNSHVYYVKTRASSTSFSVVKVTA